MNDPRNPYDFSALAAGTMPGAAPAATPYSLSALAPAPAPRGATEAGNIDLTTRPVHHNPDGTISTVRSMSIGTDRGEVLIPTIADDGTPLTPQQAVTLFRQTGRHLGVFKDRRAADAYAQELHNQQAKDYRGR